MKGLLLSVLLISLAAVAAAAQIPQTMSYQGVLTDGLGTPVADANYDLTFRIYTVSSGGTEIWSETQTVLVSGGIFSAVLGSSNALDIAFDQPYWMGVSVDGGTEYTPRRELTATPYSLNSQGVADSAITSAKVASGQLVRAVNSLTDSLTLAAGANVTIVTSNDSLIISASGGGPSLDWSLGGNAGTIPGTDFLGTTDDQALEIHVNGQRALRIEPDAVSPNLIGGSFRNRVQDGAIGTTIGGGGGEGNTWSVVYDDYCTIGGGGNNVAGSTDGTPGNSIYATVAGGYRNQATGRHATITGGQFNVALGRQSTVGGGFSNSATLPDATVGGGTGNVANGQAATVGGGTSNTAIGTASVIGGGNLNSTANNFSVVGGGFTNSATAVYATVAGGNTNKASESYAAVAGGRQNSASAQWSFVGGGDSDTASGSFSTVAGGRENRATQFQATVGGGRNNTANGINSTIGGGQNNQVTGPGATVAGGLDNAAGGQAAIAIGGEQNNAGGAWGVAAGRRAKIDISNIGVFLFADANNLDFNAATDNEFAARATGGVRFVTAVDGSGNPTAGVSLASGASSWSVISDRNAKENFLPVDAEELLERLDDVEISTWNYKTQDTSIRHIGPMAQDFYAAFGVGEDEEHVSTVDADGVALAAVKGLHEIVKEKDAQIAELQRRLERLEALVRQLSRDSAGTAAAAK